MIDDVENGMVALGAREWERMYGDAPSDNATVEDFDKFAWDNDLVAEVLIRAFGLENGDLDEEVAKSIYSGLPMYYSHKLMEDWMTQDGVRRRYDRYVKEGY